MSGGSSNGVTLSKSGTSAAPITMKGNGGKAVLDCTGLTNTQYSINCMLLTGSWWVLEDIATTGAKQPNRNTYPSGILIQNGSNNVLDRFESFGHQGSGIRMTQGSSNNLLRNCDTHHNADIRHPDGIGRDADGMSLAFLTTAAVGNRVVNCRAWWNGDDGIDLWASNAVITLEGNWAFWNGYVPGTKTAAGNGVGFKLGNSTAAPKHVVAGNLSFENRNWGFSDNGASGVLQILNNTAYGNVVGGGFQMYNTVRDYLRNNIAVPNRNAVANADAVNNSWNIAGVTADAVDFQSVSSVGTDGPRQADGSLPALPFLQLADGSDMIDRGVNVGRPFNGAAPDLGAYETGTATQPEPVAQPVATDGATTPTAKPWRCRYRWYARNHAALCG